MKNDLVPELSRRNRAAWGSYKGIEDLVKKAKNTRVRAHLFNTTVLPALTYASETWALRKQDENAASVIERSIERVMLGVTRLTHVRAGIRSSTVRQQSKIGDAAAHAKLNKIRLAGHVMRLNDHRWTGAVSDWTPRNVKRTAGRSPTRCSDFFTQSFKERYDGLVSLERTERIGLPWHLKFGMNLKDFFSNCTFSALPSSHLACNSEIFSHWLDNRENILVLLTLFIIVHFVFSVVCMTLPVPSGCFMPIFVLGAAIGRLMGEMVALALPALFDGGTNIYPGVYAVVGAASFSASVTHTVSVSVMIFEITGQLHYILPVMDRHLWQSCFGADHESIMHRDHYKRPRL
ncbi:hypothetical protein Y032_0804g2435 [Ancylostoma ceylanicum]|uniref:Chloride transporter, ClC family n=1 Tax=Ancylostoma ceylanicum TaxID=53326 RepID=A0A016WCI9_9BILA|nr:hypothetical protein Y032_0804g2435 [Ancylostoma ceylanicum]